MKIYTSYYSGQQIGKSISISLHPPKGCKFEQLPLFAPSENLLSFWKSSNKDELAQQKYSDIFREEIKAKDQVIDIWLNKISGDVTLNCYEKVGDFCHRHLVGEIIKSKRPDLWGGEVTEIQQPIASGQLTLFPSVQTTKTDYQDSGKAELSNCLDKQLELSRQENQAVQIRPDNLLGLDGFPFTKPRYKWADAPSWWNPMGEEITEDCGDCVRLAYHGRLIPKSELIKVDPVEAVKKGDYNTCTGGKYLSLLTA